MKLLTPWLISTVIIVISSCSAKNNLLTEAEVVDIIKRFDDGWRTKNLARVDSVLAPKYIYFTQSGGTFIRDSVVQTAGSPVYTLESMSRSDYEVELYGNTAIVNTRWRGKGMYKGVPFDEDQRCSIAIVKRNGVLSIISEHCTPIKTGNIFH